MSQSGDKSEFQREGALLSWIQQFAPYGVITLDKTLRVQSWNNWMEIHSGRRFEDVAGQDILTLFPDLEKRKLVRPFARALSGEASVLATALHHYLLPLPSPLRDPSVVNMLQTARVAPLRSGQEVCGVVVVIEDVTQRESQANALHRQHRRDEVLSWALAHFLISQEPRKSIRPLFFKIAEQLDFDTFLLYIRDVHTEQLGLDTFGGVSSGLEAEMASCPLFLKMAESPETVVLNSVQSRGEPEYASLKKAGIAAAVAIPLYFNGRSLGLLCFATWSRDSIAADEVDLLRTISQYLATAVDRENTSAQLQIAREQLVNHARLLEGKVEERTLRLQETVSELEAFSYSLAHDLKAPVRGMIGYCEILQEDFASEFSPEANLILQKLARAPKRLDALIRDLLQFSEISRGEIVLARVEIEPIIEDILMMRTSTVRRSTTVRGPLRAVRAHKALLQQVLSNLVDNAIKFVEPEQIPKVTIYTEVRGQTEKPDDSAIRIWIQDEGIGIHPEAHQKIFGIFERGAGGNSYEGTGMGLAIVVRAMQRMGGKWGVESELGKGSRFWVELPPA